jgi:hypothetical protein
MIVKSTSVTSLVGDEIEDGELEFKWIDAVWSGADGNIYGIPCCARRVLKFNPIDKSKSLIGPDLGDHSAKYWGGVEDDKGCVYCAPCSSDRILKIDTINSTVTLLDAILPEQGRSWLWHKGVLGLDGNI